MDFNSIYDSFYAQFRLESDAPASTEDEYMTGMILANEAINRWSNYDGTYWKELFTTLQASTQVSPTLVRTITTNDTTYVCPTDFKEAGGSVRLLDSDGNIRKRYSIIEAQEVQFKDSNAAFAYFTGNPKTGYTLNLNPAPEADLSGLAIDYDYYKTPALFTTGTDVPEMSEPYFIVHRMLANQFRGSRNPYYSSAKADAEDVLRTMQLDNNSGTWANPWQLGDTSGTVWGG